MKSQILKLVGAGAALALLAGCIVLSVYPFYTAKDLIFDPGLVGRWLKAGTTNEFWTFAAAGQKAYVLTATDDDATNCFDAHLFQLQKFQFLDLRTTNREDFQLPLHLICKVARDGTNLSLPFMDYGWLAGFLETNPAALRHIVVPEKPDDTNSGNMVYLTADTKELQKFLLTHAVDTNTFSSDSAVELKRVSP